MKTKHQKEVLKKQAALKEAIFDAIEAHGHDLEVTYQIMALAEVMQDVAFVYPPTEAPEHGFVYPPTEAPEHALGFTRPDTEPAVKF